MTPMHPHWQSTDDERDVPVRVRASATPAGNRVSRLPAAIAGIALMLGIVSFSLGGLRQVLGQLTDPTPDHTIHLTQDGPDPASINVQAGEIVRFVNDDQQPHFLSSDTLKTDDGEPFESSSIFPNEDFFYTVPAGTTPGSHEYISEASPEFLGTIVVVDPTASSASSTSAVIAPSSATSSAFSFPSSVPAFPGHTGSSSSMAPLGAGVIAVNPYAVGTKPLAAVTTHKPTKNVDTGPEVWIVLGSSAALLWAATKGAFRRV